MRKTEFNSLVKTLSEMKFQILFLPGKLLTPPQALLWAKTLSQDFPLMLVYSYLSVILLGVVTGVSHTTTMFLGR